MVYGNYIENCRLIIFGLNQPMQRVREITFGTCGSLHFDCRLFFLIKSSTTTVWLSAYDAANTNSITRRTSRMKFGIWSFHWNCSRFVSRVVINPSTDEKLRISFSMYSYKLWLSGHEMETIFLKFVQIFITTKDTRKSSMRKLLIFKWYNRTLTPPFMLFYINSH